MPSKPCASCRCWRGLRCRRRPPRSGGASASRDRPPTSACRRRPVGAGTRAGWPSRRASRSSRASRPEVLAAMAWVDSHCHVQYEGVGLEAVEEARAEGVTRVVSIGTDAEESRKAIDVARLAGEGVWATVGLHPHDATDGVEGLLPLLDAPEVVAV